MNTPTLLPSIKPHVRGEFVGYCFYEGSETPHVFTFKSDTFSLMGGDLRILMDCHGLLRIQSNNPGEMSLYFKELVCGVGPCERPLGHDGAHWSKW